MLSTGRQDYGLLRSTMIGLRDDPRFEPLIWAGGTHFSRAFGNTARVFDDDHLHVDRRIASDEGTGTAVDAAARTLRDIGHALRETRPDCLLLAGDRSETAAAALAATVQVVPIVHIHGGEETEGAIDNALRHAITKLSHLHLTTHAAYAARVRQMGENGDHIHVIPPPGVDNLFRQDLPPVEGVLRSHGLDPTVGGPVVVVTVHPTTLDPRSGLAEVEAVAAVLAGMDGPKVVTLPNADEGHRTIREFWRTWAEGRPEVALVAALGERDYWGLMLGADLMIGNSSSGLLEAPFAGLPVINVGDRQRGRERPPGVWDVAPDPAAIEAAVEAIRSGSSPRPDRQGRPAWPQILEILATWPVPDPPRKSFCALDTT